MVVISILLLSLALFSLSWSAAIPVEMSSVEAVVPNYYYVTYEEPSSAEVAGLESAAELRHRLLKSLMKHRYPPHAASDASLEEVKRSKQPGSTDDYVKKSRPLIRFG